MKNKATGKAMAMGQYSQEMALAILIIHAFYQKTINMHIVQFRIGRIDGNRRNYKFLFISEKMAT